MIEQMTGRRRCGRWAVLLVLALFGVASCAPARTPALGPAEVVYRFYRWYIGYPGNPLADREYRASPYLAPELIVEIDDLLASSQGGAYDPILLAQDVPQEFEVGEAVIGGDRATVPLFLYWSEGSPPIPRQIELQRLGDEWKIRQIMDASSE